MRLALTLLAAVTASTPPPILPGGIVVPLYLPGAAELNAARVGEAERYNMAAGVPGRIQSIVNIHNPSIEFHAVDPAINTGAAVIVVPGGGHRTLNVGSEGADLVPYLYNYGVSTVILRNRLRDDGYVAEVDAVNDALQAIRLTRSHAAEWGLDPAKIGIMGFSAGAELAAATGVLFPEFDEKHPGAGAAPASARPDFVVLIYPGPTPFARGRSPKIPRNVPPAFIATAGSGDRVHAVWADEFFGALLKLGVPNLEMHVYASGVHGGGLKDRGGIPFGTWPDRFVDWIRDLGFLGKTGAATKAALDSAAFANLPSAAPNPADGVHEAALRIGREASDGPFRPDWESLKAFKPPAWYQDAKFGIFIHWGVYSVPAFGNEWYPRNMYKADAPEFAHHVATFGPQSRFGYKDFIPLFRAERFDAKQWAKLFKAAGARFVVPVAEHHDGFPMYDYPYTDWSAAKMGPRRDVVGELAEAARAEGLVFGVSSHRAEHWWFFDPGMTFDSDVRDPKNAGLYAPARDRKAAEDQAAPPDTAFLEDWLVRTVTLVDRYHPQLVWFDWWIAQPAFHPYLKQFASYYYNRGARWKQGVAINYKKHGGESFPDEAGVLDVERGGLAAIRPYFWQTDTAVSKNSWGYVEKQDYKAVDSLVDDLVDIVSKNGALLLNIGPKPDGTIPEAEEAMLRDMGRWLDRNGEAIYGTRPWKVFGEGPTAVVEGPFADTKRKPFTPEDIRFTTRGPTLYAIALAWPTDGKVVVRSLAEGSPLAVEIKRVELLGAPGSLRWSRSREGLVIDLPAGAAGDYALALKIEPKDSQR